jgi:hypothetical protein
MKQGKIRCGQNVSTFGERGGQRKIGGGRGRKSVGFGEVDTIDKTVEGRRVAGFSG